MGTHGYSEHEHDRALDRLLNDVVGGVPTADPARIPSGADAGELAPGVPPDNAIDQPLVRLGQGDFETTIMPGDVSLRRGALLRYFKARKGRR